MNKENVSILVAEDNHINQLMTRKILNMAGYSCDIVENGQEALRSLSKSKYDVVLMDCQMPEMDGFVATSTYRELELHEGLAPGKRLPIIALTANAMVGDRERCLAAGMTDYLSKPVNPPKLIEMIERYIGAELDDFKPIQSNMALVN
jgi:CheY-like chemotaxis protein